MTCPVSIDRTTQDATVRIEDEAIILTDTYGSWISLDKPRYSLLQSVCKNITTTTFPGPGAHEYMGFVFTRLGETGLVLVAHQSRSRAVILTEADIAALQADTIARQTPPVSACGQPSARPQGARAIVDLPLPVFRGNKDKE